MWADQALEYVHGLAPFRLALEIGPGAGPHSTKLPGRDLIKVGPGIGNGLLFPEAGAQFKSGYFDLVWASHVLEHSPNPGLFLRECFRLLGENGVLAVTVPPRKDEVVGGHLTLWNAGILAYNAIYAGFDCRDAWVRTYGYNVSLVVAKRPRPDIELNHDKGDIELLKEYFPWDVREGFHGMR